MGFNFDFIEKVRVSSDIVKVVESYIPLKKAGVNYTALCPFHQEKTPSFFVSPQKQIYHCFGCGEGGNVFSFVMKMEGVSFPEAVKLLAERAHIPIPETKTSPQEKRKKFCYSVMEKVKNFYVENLKKSAIARSFIQKRGITPEMAKKFEMGYSPEGNHINVFFKKTGIKPEILEELGVLYRTTATWHDKFSGRIIFPIKDVSNRVVAFGGRALRENARAKYLNSSETLLFHKSFILYALNLAKSEMVATKKALVTEGYMDVLTLHQFGFSNACGVLGTALTQEHVYLLKRFVDNIYFVFDNDLAGIEAVLRGALKILPFEIASFVIKLEKAKDVDEFLHRFGSPQFKKEIEKAVPLMDFIRQILIARVPSNSQGKALFVKNLSLYLSAITNPIIKEEEIKRTAQFIDVSVDSVKQSLKEPDRVVDVSQKSIPARQITKREKIEREIIIFLLNFPEIVDEFYKRIKAENLKFFSDILSQIYMLSSQGKEIPVSRFVDLLQEKYDDFLSDLTRRAFEEKSFSDKTVIKKRKEKARILIERFKRVLDEEKFQQEREKLKADASDEILKSYIEAAKKLKGG